MKRLVFFLVCLCLITEAHGKRAVPLMNSGINKEVRRLGYQRRTRTRKRVTYRTKRTQTLYAQDEPVEKEKATWGVGLELGTVGRQNNTDNDFLGFHYVFGGRLAVYGPIARNWAIKPSVGYFYRNSGLSGASVDEHQIQGGFDFLFAPGQHKSVWWMGGIAQRVDMVLTRLGALRGSITSDPEFRYRAGPTTALAFRLGKTVLHMQLTGTFEYVDQRLEPYLGFTLGLIFGPSNKVKTRRYRRYRRENANFSRR